MATYINVDTVLPEEEVRAPILKAAFEALDAQIVADEAVPFVIKTPIARMTNAIALSTLATGILKNTNGTGVLSIATASDFPQMVGASGGSSGSAGMVPAPSAGANDRFLRSDGVWGVPAGGGGGSAYNTTNYLRNGSFETWENGNSSPPKGWTLTGSGAAVYREGTFFKHGKYALKLQRASANCHVMTDLYDALGKTYCRGRSYTFGAWVYADAANTARLRVNDSTQTVYSSYHTGVAGWEYLTVTFTPGAGVTAISVGFAVDTTLNAMAFFDGASVVDGSSIANYTPSFLDYPQNAHVLGSEFRQTAGTGGTTFFFTASQMLAGYWYDVTPAIGNAFETTVMLDAGVYNITTYCTTSNAGGKFDLFMDGALIGQGDFYSASAAYNIAWSINSVTIEGSGAHTLKFVCTGKHASSSNYYWPITLVSFRK